MRLQDGTGKVSQAAGARQRFYVRIMLDLVEAVQEFSGEILNSEFRGRRNIWGNWNVILIFALRLVNVVIYIIRINYEIYFS